MIGELSVNKITYNSDEVKALVGPVQSGVLQQALVYARHGLHVLPLSGKVPVVAHGHKDATTDEQIISEWFLRWPNANIGIATGSISGIFVVDVDPRNGGKESLKKLKPLLAKADGKFGTPVGLTGGGGYHIYYSCDGPFKSRVLEEYPGIDFIADKKYVVAPPSIHPDSGNSYQWHKSRALLDIPLAPIPEGLLSLLSGSGYESDSRCVSTHGNRLDGFPQFQRHLGLRDYAWDLCRNTSLSMPEVQALVLIAASNCEPSYEEDKAIALVKSAFEKLRSGGAQLDVISATKLLEMDLPAPRFTIDRLLPEGIVVVSAGPKHGKSTLARNMALSVAEGDDFAGEFVTDQGRVLYLSLEENERAMQSYLKKMGKKPALMDLAFSSPRGAEAVSAIENWIMSVDNPRLVVVDLLQNVRRGRNNTESLYEYDTDSLYGFRKLTGNLPGLTILITHHNRKAPAIDHQDQMSGSTGLAGSTDCNITLKTNIKAGYTILTGTGRLTGAFEHVFSFDRDSQSLTWKDPECFLLNERRKQVVELLSQVAPESMSYRDIAADVGEKGLRVLLCRMVKDGLIDRPSRGYYCHKEQS